MKRPIDVLIFKYFAYVLQNWSETTLNQHSMWSLYTYYMDEVNYSIPNDLRREVFESIKAILNNSPLSNWQCILFYVEEVVTAYSNENKTPLNLSEELKEKIYLTNYNDI